VTTCPTNTPAAKIAEATMEPDITLLLVMGNPPAVSLTGGNEGLASEKSRSSGDGEGPATEKLMKIRRRRASILRFVAPKRS
jgi:hypothetical protein